MGVGKHLQPTNFVAKFVFVCSYFPMCMCVSKNAITESNKLKTSDCGVPDVAQRKQLRLGTMGDGFGPWPRSVD